MCTYGANQLRYCLSIEILCLMASLICSISVPYYPVQGFFQDLGQGGSKQDVMYYWGGAKLYYIPESKAYDKLGEPGTMLHCAKHNQHV